jgi:hypothetical protein
MIQDATASGKTTVGMEEPPLVFQTRENQRKEKGPEAEKKQSLPRADRLTHGPPSAARCIPAPPPPASAPRAGLHRANACRYDRLTPHPPPLVRRFNQCFPI